MKIAVIGLGQTGGSLALAIKRATQHFILGIDTSGKRRRLIAPRIDSVAATWESAKGCDLILLCMHFREIMKFLQNASPETLILDVCSGKQQIMQLADRRKLRMIGGHPLAGNERREEKGWDPTMFEGAHFFLCRGKHVARRDFDSIRRLVARIKAVPMVTDPKIHDRFIAYTSHVPAFLSVMLADVCRKVPASFQGPGYRSMTRLSKTSPELLKTFLDSNSRNMLDVTRKILRRLKLLKKQKLE